MNLGTRDNPPSSLAEVYFNLFLCKVQPTVRIRIANSSVSGRGEGKTTRVDELSRLGRQGNLGNRDNFSSNKRFGSPNRNISRRGECHEMPRFRI